MNCRGHLACRGHFEELQLKGNLFDIFKFGQPLGKHTEIGVSGKFEFLKTFSFEVISARLLQFFSRPFPKIIFNFSQKLNMGKRTHVFSALRSGNPRTNQFSKI